MFDTIFTDGLVTAGRILICLGAALISGLVFAILTCFKSASSRSFLIGTSFLPMTVALVIALVNGNIGAGVAIAGAFGLVRFRSAQGTAKEITVIFIAMAAGLAFGMGYVACGVLFLLVCGALLFACDYFRIFEKKVDESERYLKITVPEGLNYTDAFTDIFNAYFSQYTTEQVKTVNMGSMYRLTYKVKMKNPADTKKVIDEIRMRNGNLEVLLESAELRTDGAL